MISEKKFSKEYHSFWADHTPWFRDFYNSDLVLGRRTNKPIGIREADARFIPYTNIIATTHFKNIRLKPECSVEESFEDCIPILDVFSPKIRHEYPLSLENKEIIKIQAERLDGFYGGSLIYDPPFPGYGLMANCRGDLISGTTLVEIKAPVIKEGRKPFNPEDFRQLLTYCALNYLAKEKRNINKIHLVNPRMGYLWQADLEEFVYLISRSSSTELFESIGNYLLELADSVDTAMNFYEINY